MHTTENLVGIIQKNRLKRKNFTEIYKKDIKILRYISTLM